MKRIIVLLVIAVIALPMFLSVQEAEGSVYDYSITDITQTAPDTLVISIECQFCSACNPNDVGSADYGPGCTPFACGYPPYSFPNSAACQHGSPDGRYAAVRINGSFGSVVQKLVCDQSNWPLETLWSHNFVFTGLTMKPGENVTVEADFYCSWCSHWYPEPKTYVPNKYTLVFVPLNWQGSLSSFDDAAWSHANFVIDNLEVLTPNNTDVRLLTQNLMLNFDKTNYKHFSDWAKISSFALEQGITGDRYIGITNEDIWGLVAGLSNGGSVVVVETGAVHVTAHELGHSWGLLDEYNGSYWLSHAVLQYLYPLGSPPNSYPGDDPELAAEETVHSYGRAFDGKRCIMGSGDPFTITGERIERAYCPAHSKDEGLLIGIRQYEGCSAHADRVIKQEWASSSKGLISTVVTFYRNGTTPTIESIEGLPIIGKPLNYLNPSNYSIQVYSQENNLMYSSNITADFSLYPSVSVGGYVPPSETDFVTVNWIAPGFSETNMTVEIKDNEENEVIFSEQVTIDQAAMAWIASQTTDQPDYNFGDTMFVTTDVDTALPQIAIALDVSVLDPNNTTQAYQSWTGTIYSPGQSKTLSLSLPNSGISGYWRIYIIALNGTGRLQDSKTMPIFIGTDVTPPNTTLTIGSPQRVASTDVYVGSTTPFDFNATDNTAGIGVASTAYRIRNSTYSSGWIAATPPIRLYLSQLAEGRYSIDYNSTDKRGNIEETHETQIILDNTPQEESTQNSNTGATNNQGSTPEAKTKTTEERTQITTPTPTYSPEPTQPPEPSKDQPLALYAIAIAISLAVTGIVALSTSRSHRTQSKKW